MDCEKNKEALAIVKQMIADGQIAEDVAVKYFPELAESEDEKTRKWIIDELKDSLHTIQSMYSGDYDHRDKDDIERQQYLENAIAWLEKQGEQKQEWSEEDKDYLKWTLNNLAELKDRFGEGYGKVGKCIDWVNSFRPHKQWKPSENELEVLRLVAEKDGACLMGLYKKLKHYSYDTREMDCRHA